MLRYSGCIKYVSLIVSVALSFCLMSCDDGDISESSNIVYKEGYIVKMTGALKNISSWDSIGGGYHLVVAGFGVNDSFPTIAKNVPVTENVQNFVMSGIEGSLSTVELCVVNSINKRVVSYDTIFRANGNEGFDARDTIYYDADGVDAGVYNGIQTALFSGKGKCYQCHGHSERGPAAGLLLTQGDSYSDLVGVAAQTVEGSYRVIKSDGANSILYRVMTESGSGLPWHYDHVSNVDGINAATQTLIRRWIDSGAKEK